MNNKLKPEIIDRIENDPILSGLVAYSLGVKVSSMTVLLKRNGSKFTQYNTLKVISEYTGIVMIDLLIEEINTVGAVTAVRTSNIETAEQLPN